MIFTHGYQIVLVIGIRNMEKVFMNFMNLRMMKLKNKRLEKIETLQNYLKEIDNGWNSGQVFEIETILGELIEEYNEVHNTRVETEIKCSD